VIVLIKLFYAASIASLLVLLVAFGVRTFYEGPQAPEFPLPPMRPVIVAPDGSQARTPEQVEFESAQRQFQEDSRRYEDERADYHRVVFLIAAVIGIAAIAAGLALPSRLDALRLGLVAGGLGTLIYGVIQAQGDLDNAAPELIFVVVALGLALVGYAGYRWLTALPAEP
jgi:hypothetical protein